MSLRVTFWGTRGSIPSPGAATVRYGGNTPCVEVRTGDGWLIILDAGTGIRELGRALVERADGRPIHGDIFLTHAHWDHIQGLPFFRPLFQRGNHFTIWGAPELQPTLERVVRDQMSPVVFPVLFGELEATLEFRAAVDGARSDRYDVRTFAVRHPGGAVGYRLVDAAGDGGALVYISDNELRAPARDAVASAWRRDLVEFARGARVLVHDTMYTMDEYEQHRGWGHSTHEDAVELALEAGVERLVLFHHKPERSDQEVDRHLDACRAIVARRPAALEIDAAAEGMSLTV